MVEVTLSLRIPPSSNSKPHFWRGLSLAKKAADFQSSLLWIFSEPFFLQGVSLLIGTDYDFYFNGCWEEKFVKKIVSLKRTSSADRDNSPSVVRRLMLTWSFPLESHLIRKNLFYSEFRHFSDFAKFVLLSLSESKYTIASVFYTNFSHPSVCNCGLRTFFQRYDFVVKCVDENYSRMFV